MMRVVFVVLMVLLTGAVNADEPTSKPYRYPASEYGFARVFEEAVRDPSWSTNQAIGDRILLVRAKAGTKSIVSDPVSDRYMITCYGGAIDLVHFFALAHDTIAEKFTLEAALYDQWEKEGGPENSHRFNADAPPEAHPDDLPSNAMGALFGLEIQKHLNDSSFDLRAAFEEFMGPLIPVPDAIAKTFSHRRIVMGWNGNPSEAEYRKSQAWFTAEPMIHCELLNDQSRKITGKPICLSPRQGSEALALAGFEIVPYRGQPIVIRRKSRTTSTTP